MKILYHIHLHIMLPKQVQYSVHKVQVVEQGSVIHSCREVVANCKRLSIIILDCETNKYDFLGFQIFAKRIGCYYYVAETT